MTNLLNNPTDTIIMELAKRHSLLGGWDIFGITQSILYPIFCHVIGCKKIN